MSSLSNLKSSDLEPLFPSESDPSTSPLQILILNSTGIGDDAAPFIGTCEELETLEVASTKFTSTTKIRSVLPSAFANTHLSDRRLWHHRLVQEAQKPGCYKLQANPHRRSSAYFRGNPIYYCPSFRTDLSNRCGRNPRNDGIQQIRTLVL